jgi:flagellin
MLNRVRDLIIQSANTASSDANARQAAQNEITQLRSEIDRIAGTTAFGSQKLLNGAFGAQSGRISTVTTGAAAGISITVAANSLTVVVDSGGTSLSINVAITSALYTTAASYETEIQTQVSAALTAGFTGSVSVNVRDLGSGAWSVEFVRNSTATGSKITTTGVISGAAAASGTVSNTTGGVFQVGANVTATDQIRLSVSDLRITSGTVGAFTSLAGIDVTNTATNGSAQQLIDDAITEVSNVRGNLGAAQNRFESTIANLQVTTENLAASESRIRDTDMALEMVSFTRHQVLVQAGTAMLAQANQAPQSVLRLLQ